MTLKQRKGKKSGSRNRIDKISTASNAPMAPHRTRKKITLKFLIQFFVILFSIVAFLLNGVYRRYGINKLIGHGWRDYNWTPYKWRKFIDENKKTIAIIGGPHRGGTTILWEGIKAHPEVSGFGNTVETGVSFSEGVLMQNVYPTFGVGAEFKNVFSPNDIHGTNYAGLGRYALDPDVHWTKENKKEKLQDTKNLSKLLNRFAPYWDKNEKFNNDGLTKAKVWVEKSPQNGVLSTFLEGLYNMPVQDDGSIDISGTKHPRTSATKFIFMTRHPIANCYAVHKMVQDSFGGSIEFEILLRNYIALHKYMKMDEKLLDSPVMWVRLEDFVSDPAKELKKIFLFLNVTTNDQIIANILYKIGNIYSNPNAKYFKTWCEKGKIDHGYLIEKHNKELKSLDLKYDMNVC